MLIRALDPATEVPLVEALYAEAADYWLLADRVPPDRAKAADFFTDAPPGADPASSRRLGLFVEGRLSGVAELSYGFPEPGDGYLGLMILAPRLRGKGYGARFLAHVEALARQAGAPRLCLGVLEANPRGRAFWQREGFAPTGVTRHDAGTGHDIRRFVKPL